MKKASEPDKKVIESDSQLRVKAMEHGEKVVSDIVSAFKDPSNPVIGETLKVYQELKEWGWLESCPIQEAANQIMYKKMIAMDKYRQLKWSRDHASSAKPKSKWEKVMGRAPR